MENWLWYLLSSNSRSSLSLKEGERQSRCCRDEIVYVNRLSWMQGSSQGQKNEGLKYSSLKYWRSICKNWSYSKILHQTSQFQFTSICFDARKYPEIIFTRRARANTSTRLYWGLTGCVIISQ